MAPLSDELLHWLALDAARVPGRARALVRETGAAAALAAGQLVLRDPTARLSWDAGAARAVASLALPFLADGGTLIGGPDGASLGRAEARRRCPLLLFGRGEASLLLAGRAVAIVGTRRATTVGLARARGLAAALAEADAVVVSGGAAGIDRAAHEAALAAGGASVAVLGQPVAPGVDERWPWMRVAFSARRERTLSVTRYGPAVQRDARLFAARNWTLAALSDAVVVVEGTLESGTRHTADAASAMGVPIFTWPTDVERPGSAMPNRLLESGRARPLPCDARDAAALLLGLHRAAALEPAEQPPLLAALQAAGGRLMAEEAARLLGLSPAQLLAAAANLELDGRIAREGPALVAL